MIGRSREHASEPDFRRRMAELQEIDQRISAMAEEDPMGALFVISNLGTVQGLDQKPLLGKILLRIAEKLDDAVRRDDAERARVCKALILKLVQELEVKDIYQGVIAPSRTLSETGENADDLLEEVSLEESIAAVRPPTP